MLSALAEAAKKSEDTGSGEEPCGGGRQASLHGNPPRERQGAHQTQGTACGKVQRRREPQYCRLQQEHGLLVHGDMAGRRSGGQGRAHRQELSRKGGAKHFTTVTPGRGRVRLFNISLAQVPTSQIRRQP